MIFFCYNKDGYCDHSDNCNDCDVWVHGNGGKFVPTNADRIRAMSDEELAKWALQFVVGCVEATLAEKCSFEDGSEANMLEWLQQPAKENNDG